VTSACFGISWLGLCQYDPAAPSPIYFTLGHAISALAFTLAVQQFLKPVLRFRLNARYLSVGHIYVVVFAGGGATAIAAIVPSISYLHSGILGYAIVWELVATALFSFAYVTVALAAVRPIRVREHRLEDFARGAAKLLSAANEADHVDFLPDLHKSLPVLIECARFIEGRHETSAFYDFIHRDRIRQASYAVTLLRIIADPNFCKTAVGRAPWAVASVLRLIAEKKLFAHSAQPFVQELAHQAILMDNGMVDRETGYHGFGTAPLLSESLFSDSFIVENYDPLSFYLDSRFVSAAILKRYNHAAELALAALLDRERGSFGRVHAANSIGTFYRMAFMKAREVQLSKDYDYDFVHQYDTAIRNTVKTAMRYLASLSPEAYEMQFVNDDKDRYDFLEPLVDIVYEGLSNVSNEFVGSRDRFWSVAVDVIHRGFSAIGAEPDGMNPFQQRLAIKIVKKVQDNMEGWYPAICRPLLSYMTPYQRKSDQPNPTAYNILKNAVFYELKRLPKLAAEHPEKVASFLPDDVRYERSTTELIRTYSDGVTEATKLKTLRVKQISLIDPTLWRPLTDEEVRRANQDHH
jgi:hypothetical protein